MLADDDARKAEGKKRRKGRQTRRGGKKEERAVRSIRVYRVMEMERVVLNKFFLKKFSFLLSSKNN